MVETCNIAHNAEPGATADSPAFTPLLTTADWNEEWKALQQVRRAADSAEFWDKRAPSFGSKDAPNPYVTRFLELMDPEPGATYLDMGCGNGALAIPLAQAGHQVIAADFSRGMLDALEQTAQAKGVADRIRPVLMSWTDDWDAHNVGENCVDYAFASRSIATNDLRNSLEKLTRAARKRCFCTMSVGASPRTDARLLAELGLEDALQRDYLYAFTILANSGYEPHVTYIKSNRVSSWESFDEALESLTRMVDSAAMPLGEQRRQKALAMLPEWLKADLIENPQAGEKDSHGETLKTYTLSQPRHITWAFLSWDVR